MTHDIHVERYAFYRNRQDGGTLKHASFAPEHIHQHWFSCGCTTDVDHAPVGEPDQVTYQVYYVEEHHGRTIRLQLGSDHSRGIWAQWEWPEGLPKDPYSKTHKGHAYFWLGNGLMVEIWGHIDAPRVTQTGQDSRLLLARMFSGRDVDTSKLLNGHMRSKIVNLDQVEDKVWLYHSSWGEAMAVLEEGDEARGWRCVMEDMTAIFDDFDKAALVEKNISTDALRSVLLGRSHDREHRVCTWIGDLLENLKGSELLKAAGQLGTKREGLAGV